MGFFDALDDTFGKGTALGAIEGFKEKQYELDEIQRKEDERFRRKLDGAAKGLGQTVKKRKDFNAQVTTFASAIENDPSLQSKLKKVGLKTDGIRRLARSALNTRYAEGGASGSKFRVTDLIRQIKKTKPSDLKQYTEDPSILTDPVGRGVTAEEESATGGVFGNFANILSPTRAGQERRRVAREKLAGQFPDATAKEIAEAIATSGVNAGSTNELETKTPFSVGVALSNPEKIRFEQLGKAIFQQLQSQNQATDDSIPPDVNESITLTQQISKKLLTSDFYSQGQGDVYAEDINELFNFFKNPNYREVVDMKEIQNLINNNDFNIEEYLELLKKKVTSTPPSASITTPPIQVESLEENVKNKKRD
jgi:hypothetical protein